MSVEAEGEEEDPEAGAGDDDDDDEGGTMAAISFPSRPPESNDRQSNGAKVRTLRGRNVESKMVID